MRVLLMGVIMATGLSTVAIAENSVLESYIGYSTVQPCTSWSYDSASFGYKCNNTGRYTDVSDHRDVQRLANLVDDLERKIADLESRVARLEAQ